MSFIDNVEHSKFLYKKNYKKGNDGFMFSVLTGLEIFAKFYF